LPTIDDFVVKNASASPTPVEIVNFTGSRAWGGWWWVLGIAVGLALLVALYRLVWKD